jgi:hypothetical protein
MNPALKPTAEQREFADFLNEPEVLAAIGKDSFTAVGVLKLMKMAFYARESSLVKAAEAKVAEAELDGRIEELERSSTLTQVNFPERWPDLYGRIERLKAERAAVARTKEKS